MIKKIRIIAVLATALLAMGLIAGCGGDEKADYGQEVEDVLRPLGEQLQSLGTELSAASSEQGLIDGLSSAESEIDDATSALESIDVPSDVEQVNQDLIAAISGFGDELGKLRTAAEQGDSAQLQTLAVALPGIANDFQTELSRVQDAAKEAGVPIDNSGG